MASRELRDLIDQEAEHAEAMEVDQTDRPIPPRVTLSRPNRARNKILQVRLNPDELAAIERLAERRGLPVSTVAREKLLELAAEDSEPCDDVAAQLLAAAARITELVGRVSRQV